MLLEREPDEPGLVRYRLRLYTPASLWTGEARITIDAGEVSLDGFEPEDPPGWLVAHTRAFLRAEWKGRRDPDAEPWPPRMMRWRGEKTSGLALGGRGPSAGAPER